MGSPISLRSMLYDRLIRGVFDTAKRSDLRLGPTRYTSVCFTPRLDAVVHADAILANPGQDKSRAVMLHERSESDSLAIFGVSAYLKVIKPSTIKIRRRRLIMVI